MIFFEDDDLPLNQVHKELAIQTIETVLEYTNFPYEVDVTLTVTDDAYIHTLNLEHRGKDAATDVLSFPMIDWPKPCDYDFLEGQLNFLINPETGFVILGDIVLSMDHVLAQAKAYQHSFEREFSFLIVHSMLHLLGYDHEDKDDEQLMIKEQKNIMPRIENTRESED